MYQRKLYKNIQKSLFVGKIIIVYGARQVGKTTLVKKILSEHEDKKTVYLNGDDLTVRESLLPTNYTDLQSLIGEPDILVIDEAQRIRDIGLVLKIIHDNNSNIQIIATGSSSFDLANEINEPLTGRALEFVLYPLSVMEVFENGLEFKQSLGKNFKNKIYKE